MNWRVFFKTASTHRGIALAVLGGALAGGVSGMKALENRQLQSDFAFAVRHDPAPGPVNVISGIAMHVTWNGDMKEGTVAQSGARCWTADLTPTPGGRDRMTLPQLLIGVRGRTATAYANPADTGKRCMTKS